MRTLALAGLAAVLVVGTAACHATSAADDARAALPTPPSSVYQDIGRADRDAPARALVAFDLRDEAALDTALAAMHDPTSASYGHHLAPSEWLDRHAPAEGDVDATRAALRAHGFSIVRVSRTRLLLEIQGSVGQLEDTFATEIHLFAPKAGGTGSKPALLAPTRDVVLPTDVAAHARGLVTIDPAPAAITPLAARGPALPLALPSPVYAALTPARVARTYGFDALTARGSGAAIGVVTAQGFRESDVLAFWSAFGLERTTPEVVLVAEAPARDTNAESTLDVEWAGALAPRARVVVYEAPDAYETSLLFAFHEAIGRAEVDVVTDSFSHRESSAGRLVAEQYDAAAKLAAALGITVVAASGDSSGVDVPASCPHVTAVGGTELVGDPATDEVVWSEAGRGPSRYFDAPAWQAPVAPGKRATPDLALNAGRDYWMVYRGGWEHRRGTSFAAPVFAAMVARVDAERAASGKPRVGFLNPLLYGHARVQSAFRDVVLGATDDVAASPGWDGASGWGVPDAAKLSLSIP